MGSVIDQIECPNCREEATLDFYYKTGEEYVICGNCGYHRASWIDRSSDYEDVSEPKWVHEELKNPYGVYRLKNKGEIATCVGSLENEEHWNNFSIEVMKEPDNIESFTLKRFINGEFIETKLI
jgi:Zn ribbon nucleic-acid-binding protein